MLSLHKNNDGFAGAANPHEGITTPLSTPLRTPMHNLSSAFQSVSLANKTPPPTGALISARHHTPSNVGLSRPPLISLGYILWYIATTSLRHLLLCWTMPRPGVRMRLPLPATSHLLLELSPMPVSRQCLRHRCCQWLPILEASDPIRPSTALMDGDRTP